MSGFDVLFALVLFVSVLIGYARGGVREASTLLAFVLSALAAVVVLPVGVRVFALLVHPRWLAVFVAVFVVFVLAYLGVRMIGAAATARLRTTSLGGVDRLAGGGFGLLRALVLLGIVSLVLESAPWPQQRPGWMRHSMAYPVARGAGRVVVRITPMGGRASRGLLRFVAARLMSGVADPDSASRPPSETRAAGGLDTDRRLADATGRRRDVLVRSGELR